jgi:hypothetical protein
MTMFEDGDNRIENFTRGLLAFRPDCDFHHRQ